MSYIRKCIYVYFWPKLNIKFCERWASILVLFTPVSPVPGIVPDSQ